MSPAQAQGKNMPAPGADLARVWLPALVALAAGLRLAGLGASAVWYDEAFSLALAELPLTDLIAAARLDYHPPGYHLLLVPLVRLLPGNVIAARLPSALAGVLVVYLTWRLAGRLGLSLVGQVGGTTLAAVLPYQLWQSQDARGYAVLSALVLANVLTGLERRPWLYGLTAAAALWLNPVAPFVLLPAAGLVCLERPGTMIGWKLLKRWVVHWRLVAALGLAFLSFAPWLPTQLAAASRHYWTEPYTHAGTLTALWLGWFVRTLAEAGRPLELWAGQVWVITALAALATIKRTWRLAWLALAPLALLVLYSAAVKNVILYRSLSPLAPFAYLWFAEAALTGGRLVRPLALGTWAPLLVAGLVLWNPGARGGELAEVAGRIADNWQPGDIVYNATGTSALPLAYHLPAHIPTVVLDGNQHGGLLAPDLQTALGLERADLAQLPWRRVWLVWARDNLMSPEDDARMAGYLANARAQFVGRVAVWQIAPIDVWLLTRPEASADGQ